MLEDYSLIEERYYLLIHVHIYLRSKNIFPPIEMFHKILFGIDLIHIKE